MATYLTFCRVACFRDDVACGEAPVVPENAVFALSYIGEAAHEAAPLIPWCSLLFLWLVFKLP